ncbi:MAG: hypothetical protein ACYCOR_10690 [Acidobacteriaceae bacterium]
MQREIADKTHTHPLVILLMASIYGVIWFALMDEVGIIILRTILRLYQ